MDSAGSPGLSDGRWAASPTGAPGGRLGEILDKYEALVALRLAEAGRTEVRRDAMRKIAARFPGALREWDALPLAELVRRRDVVRGALAEADRGEAPAALRGGEPWLPFALDLHTHLRALLRLRLFLRRAGAGPLDGADLAACQRYHDEGGPAWPEALCAARLSCIAAPPGGRLTDLACADVAQRHEVSVGALKRALFSVAEEG